MGTPFPEHLTADGNMKLNIIAPYPRPAEAAWDAAWDEEKRRHCNPVPPSLNSPLTPTGTAIKYDNGKPQLSLIPREALEAAAGVLAFGADKYGRNNWRGGMAWNRLIDASLRHITAFAAGEDTDPESGMSHVAHALCCLMFLSAYQRSGLGLDDRKG